MVAITPSCLFCEINFIHVRNGCAHIEARSFRPHVILGWPGVREFDFPNILWVEFIKGFDEGSVIDWLYEFQIMLKDINVFRFNDLKCSCDVVVDVPKDNRRKNVHILLWKVVFS